jgi:arsenite-transporting ATPase
MEIDPSESIKQALDSWANLANELGSEDLKKNVSGFQEWLSGVPGIDEATALSSAITHIESGQYDIIVFDTAPTGHTLKLLALPEILQSGIEKLESWQLTLWGYWNAIKGLGKGGNNVNVQQKVSEKLQTYKRGIQKVALMLQDQLRTRFVVVCIAEYLSISETKRLLVELQKNKVRASHIIVNQLVTKSALSEAELAQLEGLAEIGGLDMNQELLQKTVHACRLTTSRKQIQSKYIDDLLSSQEAQGLDGIAQVPLLAEEVTGTEALEKFAQLLLDSRDKFVSDGSELTASVAKPLYDDQLEASGNAKAEFSKEDMNNEWKPSRGDIVTIQNLSKSVQYNGLEGSIVSELNKETNRYGVEIQYQGQRKVLALQRKNLVFVADKKRKRETEQTFPASQKMQALLQDPEIQEMIASNPKFEAAVQDCLENPMNAMNYLMDPEMSPLVSKAVAKLNM